MQCYLCFYSVVIVKHITVCMGNWNSKSLTICILRTSKAILLVIRNNVIFTFYKSFQTQNLGNFEVFGNKRTRENLEIYRKLPVITVSWVY